MIYNLCIYLCADLQDEQWNLTKSWPWNLDYQCILFVFSGLPISLPFYWDWESYAFVSVFIQTFTLPVKLFCKLFGYKMIVKVWPIAKNQKNFLWSLVSWIADTVQLPCICLYNGSNHRLFHNFCWHHEILYHQIPHQHNKVLYITKTLSDSRFLLTDIIMIIAIIINIIKCCSITMKPDIRFLIIAFIILKVNLKNHYVDKSIFLYIWRHVSCTTFLLYTFSTHILI